MVLRQQLDVEIGLIQALALGEDGELDPNRTTLLIQDPGDLGILEIDSERAEIDSLHVSPILVEENGEDLGRAPHVLNHRVVGVAIRVDLEARLLVEEGLRERLHGAHGRHGIRGRGALDQERTERSVIARDTDDRVDLRQAIVLHLDGVAVLAAREDVKATGTAVDLEFEESRFTEVIRIHVGNLSGVHIAPHCPVSGR